MNSSWQAIVEALPIAAVLLAPEGAVRSANARALTSTGYTADELLGKNVGLLLPEPARTLLLDRLHEHLAGGRGSAPVELELEGQRKDGLRVPWRVSLAVLPEDRVALVTISSSTRTEAAISVVREHELFHHSPEVVFEMRVTEDGRFIQEAWNPTALRVSKAKLEQVAEHEVFDFLPPVAAEIVTAKYRECAELGRPLDYEADLDFGEGPRTYHTFLVPIRAANGKVERIAGFARDVTDRRSVEQALRESEATFATAFRASPYSLTISELWSGRYLDVNEGFLAISGYSRDEVVGKTSIELGIWVDPTERAELVQTLSEGGSVRMRLHFYTKDRRIVTVLCSAERIEVKGVACILSVIEDLSERLRANQALHAAEEARRRASEELRVIFDNAAVGMALLDARGSPVRSNGALEQLLGYSAEEMAGQSFWELVPEKERELDTRAFHEVLGAERDRYRVERRLLRKDGERTWALVTVSVARNETPSASAQRCVVLVEDISERRRAEQELRESQEILSAAFRASPDCMAILDFATDRYVEINPAFEQTFGYSRAEVLGRTPNEVGLFVESSDNQLYREVFARTGRVRHAEAQIRARDGRVLSVLGSADIVQIKGRPCVLRVARDITERRRLDREKVQLEAKLQQAQRLEALGTLAGGIAHDFNNILTASVTYTELAVLDATDPDAVREHLAEVTRAHERARDLVRQILAFSRQQKPGRRPTALVTIVKEALRLLHSTLPKSITLETSFSPDTPTVLADPTQVHQVVMNLCTNAAHAMRDRPGRLMVSLERVDATPELAAKVAGIELVRYARLSVRDNGSGMSAETLAQIFNPFFTTKAPGEGTGLGLSVVHGILDSHDGAIHVESRPEQGTVVDCYFPEHAEPLAIDQREQASLPRGHGEHVLFVDDEAPLANAARLGLERLGYRTTICTDPAEALRRFVAAPEDFELVVTDLHMPVMTGLDVARGVLTERPNTPVLLISGYGGPTAEKVKALGIREVIAKPLSIARLARAVYGALAGTPARGSWPP
jgi:PAS domain S-box-containing protein